MGKNHRTSSSNMMSRRALLGVAAAAGVAKLFGVGPANAQGDLLAQIRQAGVIRVGLANQPPYSGLAPDGSISGFVPTLVQRIMAGLGVPKVEGVVATYGELVPGLQAGRWQMIAASFRLNKDRCQQVLFTDPITFDGGAIAYVPADLAKPPRSIADAAAQKTTTGILQGSYLIKIAEEKGIDRGAISQFPNNPALIDGLLTRRAQVVISTYASLRELQRQRGGRFEIVYPLVDDRPVGSAPAFRRQDTALHAAFQERLRAMIKSGDLNKLAAEFGFDPPPADMQGITADGACARVS
jgi:polar amino acid transport system substrate-binding protein